MHEYHYVLLEIGYLQTRMTLLVHERHIDCCRLCVSLSLIALRQRIDSLQEVWPNNRSASVFNSTSLSTSGKFFCRIWTSISVDCTRIVPTLAIDFWLDALRISWCFVLLSSLSQISAFIRGTVNLSHLAGCKYLSIFFLLWSGLISPTNVCL